MKHRTQAFENIYQLDAATNCYMIEVGLDNYSDIFSEWDPAPFKRRELHPDLQEYLEGSSEEIPFRYGIELFFTIPPGQHHPHIELEARRGLETSLAFKLFLVKKELKKMNQRVLLFFLIGFIFIWVSIIFEQVAGVIPTVLIHGLVIVGWVFIWEAVSLLAFTNRELFDRYRTYKRLSRAGVIFKAREAK